MNDDPAWSGLRYGERLANGRIRCTICPRACALAEGQTGFCGVRQRQGDGLLLSVWGDPLGLCIESIEKKPLAHWLPGSPVLSFGTYGCNLACRCCQNWSLSRGRPTGRRLPPVPPEAIAEAARQHRCPAVAATYNDPVVFLDYALAVGQACRDRAVALIGVTAGAIQGQARRDLWAVLAAVNIDFKVFDDRIHRDHCGIGLETVLDTLRHSVHEAGVWTEITTLLIPGINDDDAQISAAARWIADELGPHIPWHLSAFHPAGELAHVPPTPAATLHRARYLAREAGLQFVYTGNIDDPGGSDTHCPGCDHRLIGRDRYHITVWGLDADGRCQSCGRTIPGRFAAGPGDWHGGRAVVELSG